jgi:hypothetical protein
MNMVTKNNIFKEYLVEYLKANKEDKGKILDHVCFVAKTHRKAAIRKFRALQMRDPAHEEHRGRSLYYTADVSAALKDVWESASEVYGELLHPAITEHVHILKRDRLWNHGDQATGKLYAMSERTMKRRVACFMKARRSRGISTTSPSRLKEIIPIFTGPWALKPPGYGQVDTVVHCGSSLLGSMAYSVNYTDVKTLWVIPYAQWNKGQEATRKSLEIMRMFLLFPLKGIHPDTGSEFVNWHVKGWCDTLGIEMTRSRPYHKNDNAYVEQKNGHVIRRFLGYTRIDCKEAIPVMNEFYRVLGLYLNHFIPSRKCIEKVRVGSKYKRKYDKAQTPYQRVLAHPDIPKETKEKLRKEHEKLNPLILKREMEKLQTKIFDTQKRYGSQPKDK